MENLCGVKHQNRKLCMRALTRTHTHTHELRMLLVHASLQQRPDITHRKPTGMIKKREEKNTAVAIF